MDDPRSFWQSNAFLNLIMVITLLLIAIAFSNGRSPEGLASMTVIGATVFFMVGRTKRARARTLKAFGGTLEEAQEKARQDIALAEEELAVMMWRDAASPHQRHWFSARLAELAEERKRLRSEAPTAPARKPKLLAADNRPKPKLLAADNRPIQPKF